jgi:hypothetical protein
MATRKKKPCPFLGCGRLGWSSSTYCPEHVSVAKQCVFDRCGTRIAYWNHYGFCEDHRWMTYASKRPLPEFQGEGSLPENTTP